MSKITSVGSESFGVNGVSHKAPLAIVLNVPVATNVLLEYIVVNILESAFMLQ